MNRFSERIGKKELKPIQVDSMDLELRNGLWNVISMYFLESLLEENIDRVKHSKYYILIHNIWNWFLKEPTDSLGFYGPHLIVSTLKKQFYDWDYLTVYDFVDFLAQHPLIAEGFVNEANFVLDRERSGYRLINKLLCPISNDTEIGAIQQVITLTNTSKLMGVYLHINDALAKIADRNNPDYRNSIKESISAVEAICQIIQKSKSQN